jgi:hypothetical protein
LRFGGAGQPATGSIQLSDVRFQETVGGTAVYTDKLADVPPTAPPAAGGFVAASDGSVRAAAAVGTGEAPQTAALPGATACAKATTTLASAKTKGRTLTLKGTTGCASVHVTVAKVGKASSRKALRATVRGVAWTASTKLAKGRYAVTVGAKTKLVAVR